MVPRRAAPRRGRFAVVLLVALLALPVRLGGSSGPPTHGAPASPIGAGPWAPSVQSATATSPSSAGSSSGIRLPPGPAPSAAPADLTLAGTTVLNVTHNLTVGNLTVEDSAQFDFGTGSWSATLTVEGNIVVSGDARVNLWDAFVVVASSYSGERSMALYDNASVALHPAFVSSMGYPFDVFLYEDANLSILNSELGSWTVVMNHDHSSTYCVNSEVYADLQPEDSSRLALTDCAGGTLWLIFPDGATGNVSVPAANTDTTWSFPSAGTTSGVGYTIQLVDTWPGLYAVLLNDGATVTLHDSAAVDVSLLPVNDSIAASGLRETHYAALSVVASSMRLTLENVSVESWNFYPVGGSLALDNSDLGEVMGWSGAAIALAASNLTGDGGYYATFDNSTMSITGCAIASEILAYDASRIVVSNSSLDAPGPESVLAVGTATVVAVNDTLAGDAAYAAQDGGQVIVEAPLTLVATRLDGGGPAAGAVGAATWVANGTSAGSFSAGADGRALLDLVIEVVTATGVTVSGDVLAVATAGTAVGSAEGRVTGPALWSIVLVPFVLGTEPADGSAAVDPGSLFIITFGVPMNSTETVAALTIVPATTVVTSWSGNGSVLSVEPVGGWAPSTAYWLSLGPPAATLTGVALPAGLGWGFTTAAALATVEAVATDPAAGSTGVGLVAGVGIDFSVPMDAVSTTAAFSISPATPGSASVLNGTDLRWVPRQPLVPGTTYAVAVSTSAESADGRPLSKAVDLSFTTLLASAIPRVVSWSPANGSTVDGPLATVSISFNVPMDPMTTAAALRIEPSDPGTVRVNGTTLTWTGALSLPENASYLLSVDDSATSASGVPLLAPAWASFSLVAPTVPSPSRSNASAATFASPAVLFAVGVGVLGWAVAAVLLVRFRRTAPGAPPDSEPSAPDGR
ncbi:MAG TPA: Ig-like domain-containing protein [Thermoplasmata archaeon]|nr:Ig-like domain-containing protein [Thermoplasmata archaeon]